MKHRFLKVAAVSVALTAGAVSTVNMVQPAQPVQAISKKKAVNQLSFRKVKITKKTYVRKVHTHIPLYKSTLGPWMYVMPGDVVYVRQTGTNFDWYMEVPGHSGKYAIMKKHNDYSWFTLNTKAKKFKTYLSGKTYQDTKGVKATIGSATNVKTDDDGTFTVVTATVTNNSSRSITPSDWFTSKLAFCSVNPKTTKLKQSNLLFNNSDDFPSNSQWDSLINAGDKKLGHGKSVKIAVPLQFTSNSRAVDPLYVMPMGLDSLQYATLHPSSTTLSK